MNEVFFVGRVIDDELVDEVKSLGYKVGFVGTKKSMVRNDIELDELVLIQSLEVTDEDANTLRSRFTDPNKVVFLSSTDVYVLAKARISSVVGSSSQSVESAKTIDSKASIRKRLIETNSPYNARFLIINNENHVKRFIEDNGLPIIIKPTNLNGSRHVHKAGSYSEAIDYYRVMIKDLGSDAEIVCEEFLDGKKVSVEGIVCGSEVYIPSTITDVIGAFEKGIDDFYEFRTDVPSNLKSSDISLIRSAIKSVCADIGIADCPIHAEMILTKNGPRLIEIASRFGGVRNKMYNEVYGYSLVKSELDWHFNSVKPVYYEGSSLVNYVAMYMLYPEAQGVFKAIANEAEIKSLGSFCFLDVRKEIGSEVGLSGDGFDKVAVMVLSNANRSAYLDDIVKADNLVGINIDE